MFYTHLLLKDILSTKQSHGNCNTYRLGNSFYNILVEKLHRLDKTNVI